MKQIPVLLVALLTATSCQSVVVTMDVMEEKDISVQKTSEILNKDKEKEKP